MNNKYKIIILGVTIIIIFILFLKVLNSDLKDKNKINIIGLNYKDESKNAKNFLKKYGNPYSIIGIDKKGEFAILLGAYGVPETYVVEKGKIIFKHIGPINEDVVNKILQLKK